MIQTILSNLFSTMMASKLCTNARNNNVSLHLTTPKNTLRFLGKKSSSPQAKNATLFKQLQVNSLNTTNKTCTKKHLIPVAYTVKLYKQHYTTTKWQMQFFGQFIIMNWSLLQQETSQMSNTTHFKQHNFLQTTVLVQFCSNKYKLLYIHWWPLLTQGKKDHTIRTT